MPTPNGNVHVEQSISTSIEVFHITMNETAPKLLDEGMEWQDYKTGFKLAIAEYEQDSGYKLKIPKKSSEKAKFVCTLACGFNLNVRCRPKDKVWYISTKSSCFDHSCDITNHAIPLVKPTALAEILNEDFNVSNALPTWKDIKSKCQQKQLLVSKKVAYTARKIIKETQWGNEEKEYGLIKPYLEELTRLNPGSNYFYEQDEAGHFLRCGFTAPFAAKFLNYAIPAQIHDMCHLRNQKYPGQLSHMVAQDGNHNILGLSWGLHKGEDEKEWTTIMASNRAVLDTHGFDCGKIFLLGDYDKGMTNAAKSVFPEVQSFRCTKHHAGNLARTHRASQEIRYFYTCAVMGYRVCDWEHHMGLILKHRPDIHNAILEADPTTFARALTAIPRYDLHTQGDAESINAKYVDQRSLPRFDILQQIELATMETIQQRREQAVGRLAQVTNDTMHLSVTPWAEAKIRESLRHARTGYNVVACEEPNQYAVFSFSDRRTRWLVDLDQKLCSCGRFQELKLPCVHCLSVLTHVPNLQHTAWSLCDSVYSTANWAACYETTLNSVDISTLTPMEGCLPPIYKTQRGRPKGSKRIRGADEVLDRMSQRMCRSCNTVANHNSATCRNGPQAAAPIADDLVVEI
jgi:hypothetical protein